MKNLLIKALKEFLNERFCPGRPLLLGYSGGPDSEALLQLLLECRAHFSFELHLAHVDHGWRAESRGEAEILRQRAKALRLPFFLETLSSVKKNNLEEEGRNARMQFFYSLHQQQQYQALLLGHQADDHAESVLKRVFEGAHWSKLCALYPVAQWQDMAVWRPLVGVRKHQLVRYLEERSLSFFTDPTNQSERFLRGKMRCSLLPLLAQTFGKEIIGNLCSLGRQSGKIREYFEKKTTPYLENRRSFAWGSYLDLPIDVEEIEVQFLLKQWFAQERCAVSRQTLEAIVGHRRGVKVFPVKEKWIYLRRNRLFVLDKSPASLKEVLNKL